MTARPPKRNFLFNSRVLVFLTGRTQKLRQFNQLNQFSEQNLYSSLEINFQALLFIGIHSDNSPTTKKEMKDTKTPMSSTQKPLAEYPTRKFSTILIKEILQ
jgi:hypothetical protein